MLRLANGLLCRWNLLLQQLWEKLSLRLRELPAVRHHQSHEKKQPLVGHIDDIPDGHISAIERTQELQCLGQVGPNRLRDPVAKVLSEQRRIEVTIMVSRLSQR